MPTVQTNVLAFYFGRCKFNINLVVVYVNPTQTTACINPNSMINGVILTFDPGATIVAKNDKVTVAPSPRDKIVA